MEAKIERVEGMCGDITFTGDGRGHALSNSVTEDLVFMALIILG